MRVFTQVAGKDFSPFNVYAAVSKLETIRIILAISAYEKPYNKQIGIRSVYQNSAIFVIYLF